MMAAAGDSNVWAPTEVTVAPVQGARGQPQTRDSEPRVSEVPATAAGQISTSPRRANKLVWIGAAVAVVVIAVIVYLIIPFGSASGFTLIVKGAPKGSKVRINETLREGAVGGGGIKISGC